MLEFGYTVVCPDLRGYGQSSTPETTADHAPYSKCAMVGDMMALMQYLGLSRLTLLDSVPISEALDRCDDRFAAAWWHWFFFAQPDKPERAINADPDAWYGGSPQAMGAEAYQEYRQAIHNPATVHAMLEDYRAGLGVDRDHENADRDAGHRLTCPVLVLWSTRDDMADLYGDPLSVWAGWADDLRGHSVDSGHHMAEDAPIELARALHEFLRSSPRDGAAPQVDRG